MMVVNVVHSVLGNGLLIVTEYGMEALSLAVYASMFGY